MDERIHKWLYDIKLSIEEIDSFFQNTEKAKEASTFILESENRQIKTIESICKK